MPAIPRPSPVAILVLGALFALFLVWRVLVTGFAELLDGMPTGDPLLDEVTREAKLPPPDRALRERIVRVPTDASTFLALGLELERQVKPPEARAAIDEALRLNPTDAVVSLEAARYYLRVGESVRGLDILRRRLDLGSGNAADVWPIFLAELESGRGADTLVALGRENPQWYPALFQYACAQAATTDTVVPLFSARSDAGVLTDPERACLLGRLQREQRWADARALWRASLPKDARQDVGLVFNGDFERLPSNLGFDWFTAASNVAQVDTPPTPGAHGTRALQVAYANTRYAGPPVHQVLMLPAGRYAFAGYGRAETFESPLGLQWGLYCLPGRGAGAERQLARTEPFIGSSVWTPFVREFVVPGDCTVQILRLELANPQRDATTPGNVQVRLRGTLRFDDFRIDPLD